MSIIIRLNSSNTEYAPVIDKPQKNLAIDLASRPSEQLKIKQLTYKVLIRSLDVSVLPVPAGPMHYTPMLLHIALVAFK